MHLSSNGTGMRELALTTKCCPSTACRGKRAIRRCPSPLPGWRGQNKYKSAGKVHKNFVKILPPRNGLGKWLGMQPNLPGIQPNLPDIEPHLPGIQSILERARAPWKIQMVNGISSTQSYRASFKSQFFR